MVDTHTKTAFLVPKERWILYPVFSSKVSCSSGWSQTHSVGEGDLQFSIFLFLHSQVLALQVCIFCLFVWWDKVLLYSFGWPGTHYVDQAGFELTEVHVSASWVLGLRVHITVSPCHLFHLNRLGNACPRGLHKYSRFSHTQGGLLVMNTDL